MTRERKNAPGYCSRCQLKLNPKRTVWLTLDQRTNTYTDQHVPDEVSQGGFEFGKDCAAILLAEHAAATSPNHYDNEFPVYYDAQGNEHAEF